MCKKFHKNCKRGKATEVQKKEKNNVILSLFLMLPISTTQKLEYQSDTIILFKVVTTVYVNCLHVEQKRNS